MVILQGNDALLFHALGYIQPLDDIDHAWLRRIVDDSGQELRIQNAPCMVIDLREWDLSGLDRCFKLRTVVISHGLFLIETCRRRRNRAMSPSPVGDHK